MRRTYRRAGPVAAVLAAALALMAFVGPVAAGSPQQVSIVSHVTFNPDGPNYGDFTTAGTATDSGLICPNGTFVDTGIRFAGYQSGRGGVQLQVDKAFTCNDGTGTFFVKLQIQADFNTGIESFSWTAEGGTGEYGTLRGSGSGSTVPNPPTGNINSYEGFLLH
jgi:hypothetical protein